MPPLSSGGSSRDRRASRPLFGPGKEGSQWPGCWRRQGTGRSVPTARFQVDPCSCPSDSLCTGLWPRLLSLGPGGSRPVGPAPSLDAPAAAPGSVEADSSGFSAKFSETCLNVYFFKPQVRLRSCLPEIVPAAPVRGQSPREGRGGGWGSTAGAHWGPGEGAGGNQGTAAGTGEHGPVSRGVIRGQERDAQNFISAEVNHCLHDCCCVSITYKRPTVAPGSAFVYMLLFPGN